MMSKLRSPDVEKEDLSVYLEKVVQEGGDVCIKLDNKQETVRVMTIQTNDMRKAYSMFHTILTSKVENSLVIFKGGS